MEAPSLDKTRDILLDFIQNEIVGASTQISYDDELLMSGLLNSLGVMRLVAHLDKTLGVKLTATEISVENFSTVNAIADYLMSRNV